MATNTNILTLTEIDGNTGLEIVRELTIEEVAQRKLDATTSTARQAEADAKAAARESALAKLADLGLTAEEIAAL
jgi:DNA-binding NarL/FixJ family response regulator